MLLAPDKVKLASLNQTLGTGWLPPRPDLRDYTDARPDIADLAGRIGLASSSGSPKLPEAVDWRQYCSPVENQGGLGSCTAHAAVGMVEYFQKRAFGKYLHGSRLFVYKATRNLMGVTGDTGAWLRNAMASLAVCGVPPEKYWPYTDKDPQFDQEPTAFVYSVADEFEALKYFCHDPLGKKPAPAAVLESVKRYLAAGIPSMFGFYGFASFEQTDVKGGIPYPAADEQSQWGHAVLAIGYSDRKKIKNTASGQESTGALLIRNSWGREWGEDGYGWLPYAYVLNHLAGDFWSLLNMEWIDTRQFGL